MQLATYNSVYFAYYKPCGNASSFSLWCVILKFFLLLIKEKYGGNKTLLKKKGDDF